MPKARPRKRSKRAPHTAGQTLEQYIDAQFRADPGLRRRVNALMREMLAEQAAAARRTRAKKRRARKARAR